MADPVDMAQEHMERESVGLLAARRPTGPVPTGRCHYCDEVVADDQRWCDAGCRDAWEREQTR